jgi:hypothetical protein
LPVLSFAVGCATAVEQGFTDDGMGEDTGGSQSSTQGGSPSSAGLTGTSGGQTTGNGGQTSGSGGKPVAAFGGTSSGGMATDAGSSSGGQSPGTGGGKAGSSSGGASAGAGGTNGAGGTSGSAGAGGSTAGTTSGGASSSGGSGGSSSTGDCAPANTGWVVQYWTSTAASNMPAGDVRIFNNAGGSVNFNTLELRHYFTNEETATLSFIFSTFGHNFPASPYYEDEGGANVLSSIKDVTPTVANASQYISIKFNATPGNFGNGEYAQLGYYGSLSMYPLKSNQANDYTYISHPQSDPGSANKNVGWNHITLYAAGNLVWGCEP